MRKSTLLLEDTFEYEGWEFLVTVEDTEMVINGRTNDISRGYKDGFSWKWCDCRVANVRPNYGRFTTESEWPSNVDTHFKTVEPREVPKKGLLFWDTEELDSDPADPEHLAKLTIKKLKNAYENRTKVQSL